MAEVKRAGKDITIVATSSMVGVALGAAKMLEEVGISAEVIDPRTTWPLDKQALIDSAKKTSRALVVDEGYERYGVTAEIASVIAEGAFYHLDAPVKRMGAMDVPVPFSPVLEDLTVPSEQTVFEAAKALCGEGLEARSRCRPTSSCPRWSWRRRPARSCAGSRRPATRSGRASPSSRSRPTRSRSRSSLPPPASWAT